MMNNVIAKMILEKKEVPRGSGNSHSKLLQITSQDSTTVFIEDRIT